MLPPRAHSLLPIRHDAGCTFAPASSCARVRFHPPLLIRGLCVCVCVFVRVLITSFRLSVFVSPLLTVSSDLSLFFVPFFCVQLDCAGVTLVRYDSLSLVLLSVSRRCQLSSTPPALSSTSRSSIYETFFCAFCKTAGEPPSVAATLNSLGRTLAAAPVWSSGRRFPTPSCWHSAPLLMHTLSLRPFLSVFPRPPFTRPFVTLLPGLLAVSSC